jgi:hypothetical protein
MQSRTLFAAAALMSLAAADFLPSEGHKIGPGQRTSPARGQRLKVEPTEHTRSKKKSASLSKLLRK